MELLEKSRAHSLAANPLKGTLWLFSMAFLERASSSKRERCLKAILGILVLLLAPSLRNTVSLELSLGISSKC